jgi:hypothetical protein
MLGIYWSTTERMATLEVEMALAEARIRQAAMLPEYLRLFSNLLKLRGRTWNRITTSLDKPGDWGIIFESPNVRDVAAIAHADFLTAEAEQMRRGGLPSAQVRNQSTEVQVGAASFELHGMKFEVKTRKQLPGSYSSDRSDPSHCSCGKHADTVGSVQKELSRPVPWPELDQIEADYEKALKYDWAELQGKVFSILGLKLPLPGEGEGGGEGAASKGDKAFAFDDAQRKAIMDALGDFLGWYGPAEPDSPVRRAYIQSYSLGLLMAANLMGKERPLLDILRNKNIFEALVSNGFEMVKDNATLAIKDRIIPAMEQGMTLGVNPKDVARELAARFGDQNASWERLARTEMNGAAQQAKYDEWKKRGVDTSRFVNGPRNLHPRCRCDNTVEQIDGTWYVVFKPAPDACPACMAAAEGTAAA